MNKLNQLPHPAVYGHRGASSYAPENTMSAFRLAKQQGADGIEFDVKLSADGQVVIIHDPTVNRTTNGKGLVKNLSLSEIKQLDAGSSFSSQFAGEPIPTLAELFDEMRHSLYMNVEMTNYTTQSDLLPEKVAELVRKYDMYDSIVFSSFSKKTITRIHALLPEIPVAMLANEGLPGAINRSSIGLKAAPDALHPHFSDVTPAMIEKQKQYHRKVNVWTVNQEADIRRMIVLGVDGIITNDPILALQCRDSG